MLIHHLLQFAPPSLRQPPRKVRQLSKCCNFARAAIKISQNHTFSSSKCHNLRPTLIWAWRNCSHILPSQNNPEHKDIQLKRHDKEIITYFCGQPPDKAYYSRIQAEHCTIVEGTNQTGFCPNSAGSSVEQIWIYGSRSAYVSIVSYCASDMIVQNRMNSTDL